MTKNHLRNSIKVVFTVVLLCAVVIIFLRLTSGASKAEAPPGVNGYSAETIIQYKTAYVGDNSKVVNLLRSLPYATFVKEVSLKTDAKPYEITVQYVFSSDSKPIPDTMQNNAIIVFSLVGNADAVNFKVDTAEGEQTYRYTRTQLQMLYPDDLRSYSRDLQTFKILINSFSLEVFARPERYALFMSSVPGMQISADYRGTADETEYLASSGQFLSWNFTYGKVVKYGSDVKSPVLKSCYWSPLDCDLMHDSTIAIKTSVRKNNIIVAEKQILISYNAATGYCTVIHPVIPGSLDEAIRRTLKSQGAGYASGEASTEGHIILDTEEKNGIVTAYTIASYGAYGFENGIFTVVSGSGAIPTVIAFAENQNGDYTLLEYKEPEDGERNQQSKKDMFPERLWDKVLSENEYYPDLVMQKEEQARQYLQSIERKAQVSEQVEKKLPRIDVQASNQLFSEFAKTNTELNSFPYWLGTREKLIDGIRYIYKTTQNKTSDGYDLISFQKTTEDGTVVEEYQYEIVGNDPRLIKPTSISDTGAAQQ